MLFSLLLMIATYYWGINFEQNNLTLFKETNKYDDKDNLQDLSTAESDFIGFRIGF